MEMNPVILPTRNIFSLILSSQTALAIIGFIAWFVAAYVWSRNLRLSLITAVVTPVIGMAVSFLLFIPTDMGSGWGLEVLAATVISSFITVWAIHKSWKKTFAIIITTAFLDGVILFGLGLGTLLKVV